MNTSNALMVIAFICLCCPWAIAETDSDTTEDDSVETKTLQEAPMDATSAPNTATTDAPPSPETSSDQPVLGKSSIRKLQTLDADTTPAPVSTTTRNDTPKSKKPDTAQPRMSLGVLETMGQERGAGRFSMHGKADRLQLSASLDLPGSMAVASSEFTLHSPVASTEFLMRLTEKPSPAGHVWLGASVKPLGVSRAYPRDDRLTQNGHVVQAAFLGQYHQLNGSELRLRAGILPQHLGKADTLYWTTLLPSRLDDKQLRLFDTALGLNMDYRRGWSHTLISVGQPLQRQHSPFESANGHRIQLANGWNVTHSKVLLGARLNTVDDETAYEINLHWLAALEHLGLPLPLYVEGELGSVTRPETHSNPIGALYAYHELRLATKPVQVKLRYDWTDADTEIMYDTFHLVRIGLDYQPVKYTNLSLQYRHRWSNTTNRTATTHDDLLMFVQLLY